MRKQVLKPVRTAISNFGDFDVAQFKEIAFGPEQPLLITTSTDPARNTASTVSLPAISRWFSIDENSTELRYRLRESDYWHSFKDIFLPYELIAPQIDKNDGSDLVAKFKERLNSEKKSHLAEFLPSYDLSTNSSEVKFHSFQAPLELYLEASKRDLWKDDKTGWQCACRLSQLYIAQAQISDLPHDLQDALPTPNIVTKAGKGDIYDANIWLGTPPTYTPLHKDPNPNLFVQLASNKLVRLFRPEIGRGIFHQVQVELGAQGSMSFRGEEMMQGPERTLLEQAVWSNPPEDGHELLVRPGDALFIPKGWWHSIKSVGVDVTASVNWWFR